MSDADAEYLAALAAAAGLRVEDAPRPAVAENLYERLDETRGDLLALEAAIAAVERAYAPVAAPPACPPVALVEDYFGPGMLAAQVAEIGAAIGALTDRLLDLAARARPGPS